MNEQTARALKRRLLSASPGEAAGITAALEVAGRLDIEPDEPVGYIEATASTARAWNPAYLSAHELDAFIEAREAVIGGAF